MSDDGFYKAFEDRFRGTRASIKDRLRVYLPFVLPFKELYPECEIFDLGCGRGEWLELMSEIGFMKPKGADLNDGMLAICHEKGLSVERADAIEKLQALPDESHVVISAFHLVEHIKFDMLQTLVREAIRVLKPGGILILETPNPENPTVGASSFYLDPTHLRPIPSLLLQFLVEYQGFARVKKLGLNEPPGMESASVVRFVDVLSGVSPDYAIVAQKGAEPHTLDLFESVFNREYGVTLDSLARLFDERLAKAERAELRFERIQKNTLGKFFLSILERPD